MYLVYVTSKTIDHIRESLHDSAKEVVDGLVIQFLGERRKILEIQEENGNVTAFSLAKSRGSSGVPEVDT